MGTEQLIHTLHTCFIVFLVIMVIFIILSVALFFLLDIRNIFNSLTGRAVKRTIEQMEAINSSTGRLRRVNKMAMGEMTPMSLAAEPGAESVTEKLEEPQPSQQVYVPEEGAQETTLLNAGETTVLSGQLSPEPVAASADITIGTFVVVKKMMTIHTEEIV